MRKRQRILRLIFGILGRKKDHKGPGLQFFDIAAAHIDGEVAVRVTSPSFDPHAKPG
jgi:hypothetical protein